MILCDPFLGLDGRSVLIVFSEIIVDGSVAQLTRAIASRISGSIPEGLVNCVVSRDVVELFRRDMGGDVVSGNVSDSVSQGVGSHVMVNGFVESGMGNDVNDLVFQGIAHGMVGGVRARSVDGIGAGNVSESGILNGVRVLDVNGMRVNGVNESIIVNDVRVNDSVGVTGASSVTERVMVDTVRDNGVSGVRINGVNESVVVNDVRAVSNDVRTNSGVGVTWVSSVSETVMVDAMRCNDVNGVRILVMSLRFIVNSKQLIAGLPRCHELRRSCCSKEWEDMFILYCRRAVVEESSLACEINGLCAGLTARIEEMEYFIDELDSVSDVFVPEKMAKFMKETQEIDRNRLMRLQILGREFELRADEKNRFIEKLKGNADL
ncbi:hypothetical protein Tco_1578389 [Tanacetum coccineum]